VKIYCLCNCTSGGGQEATQTAAGGDMKITMAIVHPEIVVVENAMTEDTNALILSVSLHGVVSVGIADLHVRFCVYCSYDRFVM